MLGGITFTTLRHTSVAVSNRTVWNFAEISDDQGLSAVVEISCRGDVIGPLASLMRLLTGRPIRDEAALPQMVGITPAEIGSDLTLATAVSALRTAAKDIQAQRQGVALAQALGGQSVLDVELYANINRCLFATARRPADFAAFAERAVVDGFRTVKCAPFDDVGPNASASEALEFARPGLDRVAAVRRAIGPDITLLVDCHSRFDRVSAPAVADQLAELDVGWFEEPVDPQREPKNLAEIAARVRIPVAGGEHAYGAGFFQRLVASRAVEIAMPDIKHCGGVGEAVRTAKLVAGHGGRTSLHGPSGPVSILAGAHVTAAMPSALPLEFGVYECPWRADLIDPPEHVHNGRLHFPGGPGLGVRLNPTVLQRHGHDWRPA